MPRVFISYARKDGSDLALQLYRAFNLRKDWSAWKDSEISADKVFTAEIENAIQEADYVVVVVSPDIHRPESFVQKELNFAFQEDIKKPIIAARVQPCALPLLISGDTWVNFYGGEAYNFKRQFDELIKKIEWSLRSDSPSLYVVEAFGTQAVFC